MKCGDLAILWDECLVSVCQEIDLTIAKRRRQQALENLIEVEYMYVS